jgi:hypothetical protein
LDLNDRLRENLFSLNSKLIGDRDINPPVFSRVIKSKLDDQALSILSQGKILRIVHNSLELISIYNFIINVKNMTPTPIIILLTINSCGNMVLINFLAIVKLSLIVGFLV